jgi:hypothetical protein
LSRSSAAARASRRSAKETEEDMKAEGIEGWLIETHNWGKTVAFWKGLGYEPANTPNAMT